MMTHPWITAELVAQHRADLIADANHRRLRRGKTVRRLRRVEVVPVEIVPTPEEVPCYA